MKAYYILILTISCSLLGCASSGFNRGELHKKLNQVTVTDKDIEKTLSLKPQLPKVFKLGIYFTNIEKVRYSGPYLRWTPEDKASFKSLETELLKTGKISKVVVINPSTVEKTDLKSIRFAAAQHGLDAVMIISSSYQFNIYPNQYAWSYIAIAPAFFVNGNVSESLVINRATMWDVRNQFLYMTAEVEEMNKKKHPGFVRDDQKFLNNTKTKSISKLKVEIEKQFTEML